MENKERITKVMKFPVDLANLVEDFRNRNGIKHFSVAVYTLIRMGLDSEKRDSST